MATVFDVAQYILGKLAADNALPVTTWKLQKLVYYSQAWSVVWDDAPLFNDRIEAWANGPVCPVLYESTAENLRLAGWHTVIPKSSPGTSARRLMRSIVITGGKRRSTSAN